MQDITPKQIKLLGATVRSIGAVVAVSSRLVYGYVLIEDIAGVTHHRFLADLKRDEVVFSSSAQPFETSTQRVGYGLWDEVHSLVPARPGVLQLAA